MQDDREAILQQFWPALARIAATYERIPSLREELQQEMALEIWRSLEHFRNESAVKTYLFRVAHNTGVRHVKKQARIPEQSAYVPNSVSEVTSYQDLEAQAQTNQQMEKMMESIHRLPLQQRQLITLALEGMKHKDISDVLGITVNNVAVSLVRAKASLKKLME